MDKCKDYGRTITKQVSTCCYDQVTKTEEEEHLIGNEKPDRLKDLNYVTRSKSAKKEQRARAVQRSKTIYLNLSKGRNDGALAKLIEDSTETKFNINFVFQGLWKKKKSIKFQK